MKRKVPSYIEVPDPPFECGGCGQIVEELWTLSMFHDDAAMDHICFLKFAAELGSSRVPIFLCGCCVFGRRCE